MNSFEVGFIKRAQEYGMDIQQARQLCKQAAPEQHQSRKQQAKDYLPMNAAGAVGDYLTPGTFGGHRAGKATALSKALGREPGLSTTNPLTSGLLSGGLGALGGGALGNFAAEHGVDFHNGAGSNSAAGTALGGISGGILGMLLPALLRRRDMKKNLKDYANGAPIHPEKPAKLHGAGNVLLPLSGAHRKGEAVGYNKLRGIEEDQSLDHAVNAGRLLGGAPLSVGGGILQNFSADRTMDKRK